MEDYEAIIAKLNAAPQETGEFLEFRKPHAPLFQAQWFTPIESLVGLRLQREPGARSPRFTIVEQISPFLVRIEDGSIKPLGTWNVAALRHTTVDVALPIGPARGTTVAIDEAIVPLMEKLWDASLVTLFSCTGGVQVQTESFESFSTARYHWRGENHWTAYPYRRWRRDGYCMFADDATAQAGVKIIEQFHEITELKNRVVRWVPEGFENYHG